MVPPKIRIASCFVRMVLMINSKAIFTILVKDTFPYDQYA